MPSSTNAAYGLDGWKEKLEAELRRAYELAAIKSLKAHKKGREGECKQYKIKFYPSQSESFGNTLPKEIKSIGGSLILQRIAPMTSPRQL